MPKDLLRQVQDLQQTLSGGSGTTGYKALLRRLGDILRDQFGAKRLTFVRVSRQDGRLQLKRRNLKLEGVEALGEELLPQLATQLTMVEGGEGGLAAAKDGIVHVSLPAVAPLCVALVEDPGSRDGTLILWEAEATTAPDAAEKGALCEYAVRFVQNECRWHRKLDKTQALLYRDDLTGLYNMRYLEVVLESELRRAQRFPAQFCLLFIDLDGFKKVNDEHGHLSGSSVLKQVADVLRDAVREVDVPIRYGGDEFVVVLLGASPAKGHLAAERVRRRIEQKEFQVEDGATTRLTCSIGLAAYPEHGKDRETLLKVADESMYHSKRGGKNRVTVVGDMSR